MKFRATIILYFTVAIAFGAVDEDRLAEAKEAEQQGLQAMQESNDTPSRIVDAAILLTAALKIYEEAEDFEQCQQLKANIFWCKKRMNLDDLNAYLARKGKDEGTAEALAKFHEVADAQVPVEQAEDYFKRAQAFAEQNPGQLLQIAVRYFEVAERFPGTDIGLQAQKLSLQLFLKNSATLPAPAPAPKTAETIFTRTAAASGELAAAPGEAAQKTSRASMNKMFKDEKRSSKTDKARLAAKILGLAGVTTDDPDMRYVMLQEAVALGQQCNDLGIVFAAIDDLAAHYQGVDAVADKKSALGKMKSCEAAAPAMKLFDDPADPAANFAVGRHLCLASWRWDDGLPLLARGSDPDFKNAALMELEKPTEIAQRIELADRWYDLARKAERPNKDPMLAHAGCLYQAALPSATGVTKRRLEDRLKELDDLAFAYQGGMDLFPLLTLEQGKFRGAWSADNGVLKVRRKASGDHLTIPLRPEGDYVFDVDFKVLTPEGNYGEAMVLVPMIDSSLNVFVYYGGMGIHRIDGKMLSAPNASIAGLNGKRQHLTAQVIHGESDIALTISLDGAVVFEWKGPKTTKFTNHPDAIPTRPGALGIGSWNAEMEFYQARLRMLSGAAMSDSTR